VQVTANSSGCRFGSRCDPSSWHERGAHVHCHKHWHCFSEQCFNTPVDSGDGTARAAASGAGLELSAIAAALTVVDSTAADGVVVDSAWSPANATEARSVVFVKDSAFEQLSTGATARLVLQHIVAGARWVAVHEFSRDWASLLSLLVDHKTGCGGDAATHSTAKNFTPIRENSCTKEGQLGANLAPFGRRKVAASRV
jgi:hypothetical protein